MNKPDSYIIGFCFYTKSGFCPPTLLFLECLKCEQQPQTRILMKTFQYTLLLIISLFWSTQVTAQDIHFHLRGHVSPNYTIHYLTMELIQRYNLEGKDEVELSPKYVEMITKAFSAIQKSKNSGSGQVMPYTSMNQVKVTVKNQQFWEDAATQALLKKYGLKYKTLSQDGEESTRLIYGEKDFNTRALATLLKKNAAVKDAHPASTGIVGSGSSVQLTLKGNTLKVSFGRGSGDCPSGCINWVYKNYEVDTRTYAVKFLGRTGTGRNLKKLPPPENKGKN